MKTLKLAFFAFCILFTLNLSAQESNITYGVKAGVNLAKYISSDDIIKDVIDYNHKVGFYAGGFLNVPFSKTLKLQPELLFAQQGTNTSSELTVYDLSLANGQETVTGTIKSRITESLIVLPVILQIYPTKRFFIEVGPQFGYIVDMREKYTANSIPDYETSEESQQIDCQDNFDFGGSIGLGYNFTENFGVNARYYRGLIKREGFELKSSVFNLGVNYRL